MHILFEAVSVMNHNRECKTEPERLHYYHGAGAPTLGIHYKRLYSGLAATISILLQPQDDPYKKY